MIHPTSIINSNAELSDTIEVGPYTVIGEKVKIESGATIGSHVVIEGPCVIGKNARIFPHAVIGTAPQDTKYKGEPTKLVIGNNCVFREFTSINRGTSHGGGVTAIGDNCLFMANSHVAHDCKLGNGVVLANSVALAGHVTIGDFVWFGGLAGVHQFVNIGSHAFIGAGSMVRKNIPPYLLAQGDRAKLVRVNEVGLKRHHYTEEQIREIAAFYEQLKNSGVKPTLQNFDIEKCSQVLKPVIDFLSQDVGELAEFL